MKKNLKKYIFYFVLFPVLIFGAAFPEYRTETLSVKGEIQQIQPEDLNADGAPDLLVLHTQTYFLDTKIRRFISIFFQENGELSKTADQTFEANNGEIVFHTVTVTDVPGLYQSNSFPYYPARLIAG